MARRVVRQADRALRDEFKLKGWVSKVSARRQKYFSWCDRTVEFLTEIGGGEALEEAVIQGIVAALMNDQTFETHVDKKGGRDFLSVDENWPKLYRAGAATIYHEYLVAVEKGDWPGGNG